jgi:hypothetical protein
MSESPQEVSVRVKITEAASLAKDVPLAVAVGESARQTKDTIQRERVMQTLCTRQLFNRAPADFVCHIRVARCPARRRHTSNNVLVCTFTTKPFLEVAGIEPASSGAAVGLLRAQPARDCRGRHFCRRQCRPVTNGCVLGAQLV